MSTREENILIYLVNQIKRLADAVEKLNEAVKDKD